jgi:sigma-B regulation protein RsbU (phosphoserine phosphatase)
MKRIASEPGMAPWRTEAMKRGYASSISIPLVLESGVFGALMIYSGEADVFGDKEVALLGELASDLAFGIQTLRTRADRELILDSTAEAICGLDANGACTWVNQASAKMLGYPNADAIRGRNLHEIAHYARRDGTPVPQDKCPATRALQQGEFVHVDDDVMWRADGTAFPVEFWSYPMRRNGENVGAVVTFLDITERQRAAQLQIANQAMEQAHEREIEIGNRIQQTLLLDQPPQDIPGLRIAAVTIPSQKIDGDFYIFLRHSDECLDVIVGDVMGKGIPAALLGAATKSHFLRALNDLMGMAKNGALPEPKDIVMLAHAELAPHLIELDSFVTACYARVNLRQRRLDLVDCGHTGILLRHASTGLCSLLHGDNLPLGVREGELYDQAAVAFEPGDLLVFFSDGITEARNSARELFGNERLEEYVRVNGTLDPGALADGLRKAVATFAGSSDAGDDLTIVAVRMLHAAMPVMSRELDIASDLGELRRVREFVRVFCTAVPGAQIDEVSANSLELAVNEAVSNIMKHAYHGRRDQSIRIEAEAFESHILIRLFHLGDPFNPATVAAPPLDGSRESGFGAWIIARSVDEVRYYGDERGRHCVALKLLRKPSDTEFRGNHHGNRN